jgi:hypothetical protein
LHRCTAEAGRGRSRRHEATQGSAPAKPLPHDDKFSTLFFNDTKLDKREHNVVMVGRMKKGALAPHLRL